MKDKAAIPLPESAVGFYVQTLARSADALRASFEFYRAIDEIIARDPISVVIANCGHYLPEEQPEALLEHLLPFLSSPV